MKPNQKLYIVTREDLPSGAQAVQGMHALMEFCVEYPGTTRKWYTESNHLCFLSVKNLQELEDLADHLHDNYIIRECFFEPDLNDEMTAVAVFPSDEAAELLSHLPLALNQC